MRNAARLFLHAVCKFTPKPLTRPERVDDGTHVVGRRNDEDIGDIGADQLLDAVPNHRLLAYGQKVLVGDLGKGPKSCPHAASEYHAPHRTPLCALRLLRQQSRRPQRLPIEIRLVVRLPSSRPRNPYESALWRYPERYTGRAEG